MNQLPQPFLQSIQNAQGFDEIPFIEAHQHDPIISIRLNPFKPAAIKYQLNNPVPWSRQSYYLENRPNFTYDVYFQAGCYYVQEAGSIFIEHILQHLIDFNNDLAILDACAAPGGKSTLINSLLNNTSVLVTNELIKSRADVLCQNINKWGTNQVIVTNNDPSAFEKMHDMFDVILVDAPCSGSGLFRKQHDAINEWSIDLVHICSQRQKRILSNLINSLKEGGILVYSTCSYSEEENEVIADWLISEFSLETLSIPINPKWNIIETTGKINQSKGYRFYPNKTKSEGFFCAVFKKPHSENSKFEKKKKRQSNYTPIKPAEKALFKHWIKDVEKHEIIKFNEDYLLMNKAVLDFINLYPTLYYKKVGTRIGTIVNKEIIPNHELALSIHRAENISSIPCTEEQAILFLKKNLQQINGHKGWNLMKYEDYGIGWIKHLGNRINNYLPNDSKILK